MIEQRTDVYEQLAISQAAAIELLHEFDLAYHHYYEIKAPKESHDNS